MTLPQPRLAVRVLLINEANRILLFRHAGRFRVGGFEGTALWAPPGGGLEPGETHEEAACRELQEETGLTSAQIGPCVWLRDLAFTWNDVDVNSRERFYVCRTPQFAVDVTNQADYERQEMTSYRWWSRTEIEASNEVFVPRDLAALLAPILRGEMPAEPLRISI
ncbi:MAG TPA: NUDIX domain-containing protein [Dehalococcoidia bacterium]|jgi:8-oxo-dGTP pyrophosphatase MutT (NUDIX family)|nr:NUDIX domain-containing protein [Dehalococcoidia bacterium]